MSVNNFIPTVMAAAIMKKLEGILVARQICYTDFEGQLSNAGGTVKFPGLADPTISDYTGSVTWEALEDGSVIMNVDQKKYFAITLDDVDKAQAQEKNLLQAQADRAAYQLKKVADQYVLGLYAQADSGNAITDTSCDSATILSDIAMAAQKLSEQDVPVEDRWLVIPPWVQTKLELAGIKFQISGGSDARTGLQWAQTLGFTVYVSNNLTNTAATPVTECLAGSKYAIAYADQIVDVEAMRLQDAFADGIRGLHVYGAKVVKPKELVRLTLTCAAETAI